MDGNNLFDAYAYFSELCKKNKLAREYEFQFCRCSGINFLQEALDNFKEASAFMCIDDTTDGNTFSNGGYFQKRVLTVFLLKKYKYEEMQSRMESLSICRSLFAQLYSRMIKDSSRFLDDFIYLRTERVHFREVSEYAFSGCTGLYFMIDVDEPINLCYDGAKWD